MDDFSAQLFSNVVVSFDGYEGHEQEIQDVCQAIFGHPLTEEDFIAFLGVPDGSSITLKVRHQDDIVELSIDYTLFEETATCSVYLEDGNRVVDIENFHIKDEAQDGLGTRLIARQISCFQDFGIDLIKVYAAGYPDDPSGFLGYYFWPRLGFIMYDLGNIGTRLSEAGLSYVENTLDLFSQEGGAEWWRKNGNEGTAYFFLHEGSASLTALYAYLETKGVDVNGDTATIPTTADDNSDPGEN